jgi:threonyl-tRNA synthetase
MKNNQESHIDSIRHSLAHVLAMAVLKKFPKAKFGIGPVIENGFYYDFKLPKPISDEDLPEIEKSMKEILRQNLAFAEEKITPLKGKKLFNGQPFKLDLIKDFTKEKKQLTAYHTGDFTDLCRGGHIKNTSEINPDAFTLTKVAGAYWKGDEKKAALTRIYGLAFETKEELIKHLELLEEAKKRDHKKLGADLGLFTFSDLVGSGLPLWTPKGTVLRDVLDNVVWEFREKNGYEKVDIPHIAKKDLYEKSGHWDKFQDEIFKIKSREGHIFVLKPMNCPHHTQIYAGAPRSYKDLPIRYANTTKVYRDEQSGELSGLTRVRSITQDDAHVFCRDSQIESEMERILGMINGLYEKVGISLSVRLSFHDPEEPTKYLGTPVLWKRAEEALRRLVKEKNMEAVEAPGEAAFYGPKVDFIAKDSLGREWQVATMQLDMNLPERFDLTCTNEEGKSERIVMIHAAIMGSLERFIAMLIEHYAGAFPFWLAPIQVTILSVNDKVLPYCQTLREKIAAKNIRVSIDARNESVGKKIRENEMQKIPYMLIVGEKEAAADKVSIRERGGKDGGQMDIEEFLKKLHE